MSSILQKRIFILILMCFPITALILTAPARVFLRRAASGSAILETTAGWHKLFDGAARINNERGRLAIYGCRAALPQVTAKLQAAYANDNIVEPFRGNTELAIGRMREGANIITLLVYAGAATDQTLVFALTRAKSAREHAAASASDTIIPIYPGGRSKLLLEYDATNARFELCAAPADQDAVRAYYEEELRKRDWQRLDQLTGLTAGKSPLAVFQKDDALLCLLVAPDNTPNWTTIMILRKYIKME